MSELIPLDKLEKDRIYQIRCRNLLFGVYDGNAGFIGIREKYGQEYLSTEYHAEYDGPFKTVRGAIKTPFSLPNDILPVERFNTIDLGSGREVNFDKPVKDGGKGWMYSDTGEANENIVPVSPQNDALFNYMQKVEKAMFESAGDITNTQLDDILAFGLKAHATQARKATGAPYSIHLIRVMSLLAAAGYSKLIQAAGFLHDVNEDTSYTVDEYISSKPLSRALVRLSNIVKLLSEHKYNDAGERLPWIVRKGEHLERLKEKGDAETIAVKLADLIHNICSIREEYTKDGSKSLQAFRASQNELLWYWEENLSLAKLKLGESHFLTLKLSSELQTVKDVFTLVTK